MAHGAANYHNRPARAYRRRHDNIGNRRLAFGGADYAVYTANELNQYTKVDTNGSVFTPEYDADGNQTLVQTSTGIWKVDYNAQNRAVKFEREDGNTVITCAYDYMGRRIWKKVTTDGTVTLRQRYLYRGYLQIACLDLQRAAQPALWYITWDPTQNTATRPLAIQKDGTWYTYGWDLTKNICEIYGPNGNIRTIYTYTPYGTVNANGDVTQPIQWSSEYHDTEHALIYYNYRYYNPTDGQWTRRDPIAGTGYKNDYCYVSNLPTISVDLMGLISYTHNLSTCKLYVRLSWDISFIDDETGSWSDRQKRRWKLKMQDVVETYFNSYKNTYRCISKSKCCKKCKNGLSVKFNLSYVNSNADYTVEVHYDQDFRSYVSWDDNTSELSSIDIEEVIYENDGEMYTQTSGIHEVGHMLNLVHPGQKLPNPAPPNTTKDYSADPESLMGFGHELRIDDYASAFCSNIPSVEKCSQWTVATVGK